MDYNNITQEADERVAIITLNCPEKLNPLIPVKVPAKMETECPKITLHFSLVAAFIVAVARIPVMNRLNTGNVETRRNYDDQRTF